MKVTITIRRIEKVKNLLFVDSVANEAEALLVRRPHGTLDGRGRVVHHLGSISSTCLQATFACKKIIFLNFYSKDA